MKSDDFGERCRMVLAVHFTITMKRENSNKKVSGTVAGPVFDHRDIFTLVPY